LTSDREGS